MKHLYQRLEQFHQYGFRVAPVVWCFVFVSFTAASQCPSNIDFETGTFTGWQCYTGSFSSGNLVLNPSPPVTDRHTMLSFLPGDGADFYGGFPKNCPNGSGHSIQLGNASPGGQAESISYTFTIPAGQNEFTLIYNYAIVLQDFNHVSHLQPRLRIDVTNVTDDILEGCSTMSFIVDSILPGFQVSPNSPPGAPVRYKDWSAMSVNLSGYAGKTFRIQFTTTDCGATDHFGYAYIDINSQCSGSFIGATFCPGDTAVLVTAPFGFQNYTWWNNNFTQVLGTAQTLHYNPPPTAGTIVNVELIPYNGYGCKDTLTAHLLDTLRLQPDAGPDRAVCPNTPVQLGKPPEMGMRYSWNPATGLSNPNISNPVATVSSPVSYVLTVTNYGGGCVGTDTVNITLANLDTALQVRGNISRCSAGDSTILKVMPADSIQWYRNNIAIPGANQTSYRPIQTGLYHAVLFGFGGCHVQTRYQQVDIYESPVPGFTINNAAQCFNDNQFIFTNTSSITSGSLQYNWNMGDGYTDTTKDITHHYLSPGIYTVKLLVKSNTTNCSDTVSAVVTVYASPVASFTVNDTGQCFKDRRFAFTNTSTPSAGSIQYNWNMGDGTLFNTRDVAYNYSVPGSYMVKMLVMMPGGCTDSSIRTIQIYPSPVAGFTVNTTTQCQLNNRFVFTNTSTVSSGSMQYYWNFGDGLADTVASPVHTYAQAGVYQVKMVVTGEGNCADSTSYTVTVYPVAHAAFTVSPACINVRVPVINLTSNIPGTTVNYSWDFGNGYRSTDRIPVYQYTTPGTYSITLTVTTAQCPLSVSTKKMDVVIDAPLPGIMYPVKNAISYFPETLQARNIGNSVIWIPATSLDNRTSYMPVFKGPADQLYRIQLRTASGCITVDTQWVVTRKNIKIYVPTVFTPGNDGKNDLLRPLLMSFVKVNYFRIYDRWGKLLFEMKNDRPGWDGRVNGQPVEMQTVVWVIEAIDVDGVVHREQGTTVLIR